MWAGVPLDFHQDVFVGLNHQYSYALFMQSHPGGTENAMEDRLK